MKKIIGLLCLIFCLIVSIPLVYADNTDSVSANKAKNIVRQHLYYMDHCRVSEVDAYHNTDSLLDEYLKIKESVNEEDIIKYNYGCSTSIVEEKIIDNVTYCKVNAQVSWKYEGADVDSGYGKNVDVLIDNTTGNVIDLFDRESSFDISMRGQETNIQNKDERLTNEIVELAKKSYNIDTTVPTETESTIGGTDGPTDIQVVSRFSPNIYVVIGGIVLLLLIVCVVVLIKKKSK